MRFFLASKTWLAQRLRGGSRRQSKSTQPENEKPPPETEPSQPENEVSQPGSKTPQRTDLISRLPTEVLQVVLDRFSPSTAWAFALCSHRFYELVKQISAGDGSTSVHRLLCSERLTLLRLLDQDGVPDHFLCASCVKFYRTQHSPILKTISGYDRRVFGNTVRDHRCH